MRIIYKIKHHKLELILVTILLVISGITNGYNMFNFPYFENDEGVYISNAWALVNYGKLSPYTYWYDHAPAGWIFIALWTKITGGFFTFGESVNSGRVFMLLLHISSSFFVYFITRRLSKSILAASIAVLIFTLSPLGIYFQRRVLLDNIMTFWVLLSLTVLFVNKLKLRHVILSAICFGVAVLTKENAIFFLPGFLYVLDIKSHKHHKSFAIAKWIVIAGLIISLYFLYAFLKNEFFPIGFFGDKNEHVSLLTTLQQQIGRGGGKAFWEQNSDFFGSLKDWLFRDKVIVYIAALSYFGALLVSIKRQSARVPLIFSSLFLVFLLRGGLILNFYIIPLIPFIGIQTGIVVAYIIEKISFNRRLLYIVFGCVALTTIILTLATSSTSQYTENETSPQLESLYWIYNNVPKDAVIAIDDFAEIDLREKGYKNVIWFWKIWDDKNEQKKFKYEWRNIDYIYLSHEMVLQLGESSRNPDYLKNAFINSREIVKFGPNNSKTHINLEQLISTNGDWNSIRKINTPDRIILDNSWKYYKNNFIISYGQVVDPSRNITTSEGQSYAMLRSVILQDRNTFDGVWQWTKDHLRYRDGDRLFSWKWDSSINKIQDTGHATDADTDIALALILGSYTWDRNEYMAEARAILEDIWRTSVVNVEGRYLMHAGTGFEHEEGYVINPSYLFPAAYKIFSTIDKKHPWDKLSSDSYYYLNEINQLRENSANLPTNWILVTKKGEIVSAKNYTGPNSDFYGYDAFRTMWRVAADYVWFKDQDAKDYLDQSEYFFTTQWTELKSEYTLEGVPLTVSNNTAVYTGPLLNLLVTNPTLGKKVYKEHFLNNYNHSNGYWGNGKDYYDQNWAWFATALFTNNFILPSKLVEEMKK